MIAIAATVGFGIIYSSIMWAIRGRLNTNSNRIARESNQVIKSLQEGLGGIRDILLDGSQAVYCRQYRSADIALRHAQGSNSFLSSSPRYLVESVSMVLIAALAYLMSQGNRGLDAAVPILGALALGAQRMLPAMQMAYAAWASLRGELNSMKDTVELLEQRLPDHAHLPPPAPLTFRNRIELENVSFRYTTDQPWILRKISLTIDKGRRIGFIGATGSGKSTLLDIIMGLLQPSEGAIIIDGEQIVPENLRHWQACVAHVPQSIFLADSSVEENIAFGVDEALIDRQRLRQAAQQAQIHETIESWPEGYKTLVGERGVRLSGGQRQRIGIARALYRQAQVIIFDEATSALDQLTEEAVISSIEALNPNLTILMIAHRLSTLNNCSQILRVEKCKVHNVGTFDDCLRGTA
jgi:ATP-binding cassette subfamily B protein